jgi:hypothetical protein
MELRESFPNLWAALTARAGTRRDAGVVDPAIEPGHLRLLPPGVCYSRGIVAVRPPSGVAPRENSR